VASSAATTISALPASPTPPPRQKPCLVPWNLLHFLDVHPGAEAAALGGDDHRPGPQVGASFRDRAGQVEPARNGQRIDRGVADDDLGDAAEALRPDAHRRVLARFAQGP
jgi:hypothetical protein